MAWHTQEEQVADANVFEKKTLDENNTSEPCGAINIIPNRTASVPYSSKRVKGSGEFPNDLLNFLPVS